MAITTLVDYWTDRKAAADLAVTSAQTGVTEAQARLEAARRDLRAGNAALAALLQGTAALRAAMADAVTPADVDALKPQLAKAIADTRARQARSVEQEAEVDAAQTALDVANAEAQQATARASAVTLALQEASATQASRQKLRDSLGVATLQTMPADATAALAAEPFTDAKSRIEADIPQELRDCAIARAEVVVQRAESAARFASRLAAASGKAGDFAEADQAFRDYAANAKARFDHALGLAERVADPQQSPLTSAERAEIHNTASALHAKRVAAAAACKDVSNAQIEVDARQADLDIARFKAAQADIDADAEANAAVVAAKGALAKAEGTLAAKQASFALLAQDLADWIVEVPDSAWRNLADFAEAQRLLTALKADPAPLATAVDDAEKALVTALGSTDKLSRAAAALQLESSGAAARARFETGSLGRRLFGALQGAA